MSALTSRLPEARFWKRACTKGERFRPYQFWCLMNPLFSHKLNFFSFLKKYQEAVRQRYNKIVYADPHLWTQEGETGECLPRPCAPPHRILRDFRRTGRSQTFGGGHTHSRSRSVRMCFREGGRRAWARPWTLQRV